MSNGVCDEKIYKLIFFEYAHGLRNYLYYKTADLTEATNTVQELFLELWKDCDSVTPEDSRAYLYDKARSVQPNPQKPNYHFSGITAVMTESISALPLAQGISLLMHRIDKSSYDQISTDLNVSEEETEIQIHSALRFLKDEQTGQRELNSPGPTTLYARWLDGDLTAQEIKDLKGSGNWEALEQLVKAIADINLPAYDTNYEFEKLREAKQLDSKLQVDAPVGIKMSTILSAAGSLIILLGAIFFLKESAPVASAKYGETIAHQLDSESIVILNDGSSIKYDQEDWPANRILNLKGEAFFDLKGEQSIIVETNLGTVEGQGASFSVRAWKDNLRLECYRDRVQLSTKNENQEVPRMSSVQTLYGRIGKVNRIDNEKPYWTNGISSFESEPINNVFAEVERQYDITIDRPRSENLFTGNFPHDNLEKALRNITDAIGLKYHINPSADHVIISK